MDVCDCPIKIVPRKDFDVVFQGLDSANEYLVMVSRKEHLAFYGVPSEKAFQELGPEKPYAEHKMIIADT
jgi:hypothetical protein